jgi:hypothetical protein
MNALQTSWNSYPKIWNFGHPATKLLVGRKVRVEEKVDGSQFSFGMFETDEDANRGPEFVLRAKSRRVEMNPLAPTDLFCLAAYTAQRLFEEEVLHPGWTYRGEAFKSTTHNSLEYERVPLHNIAIFDIARGENDYLSRAELEVECERLGLEPVPCYGEYIFTTYAAVAEMLDRESYLGKNKIEGVVLKPVIPLFGEDAKPLYTKVVSEAFRELHAGNSEYKTTKKTETITAIAESVSTLARWQKVRQHCQEEGKLVGDPRDLQYLIKDLQADIVVECEEHIKAQLWSAFRKKILGASVRGFPEWYKSELAKDVFSLEQYIEDEVPVRE